MNLRHLVKRILFPVLRPLSNLYLSKERKVNAYGLSIFVPPSVFHPGLYFSTHIFVDFLKEKDLKGKRLLELGAGSGLISLFSAKSGALVTSSDINNTALSAIKKSATANNLTIRIVYSDLFDNIHEEFDVIVINPPYYPSSPKNDTEKAFYCGPNFEYFKKLFKQLKEQSTAEIYMVLSEDCDLEKIKELAKNQGFKFLEDYKVQKLKEWNYIFKVYRF